MQTVVPHIISRIYEALPLTRIRFGVINARLELLSKFRLIYCDFHDVICGFARNVLAVMSYKNPNGIHYTTRHESIPPMFLDFNDALVDSLHSHLDFFYDHRPIYDILHPKVLSRVLPTRKEQQTPQFGMREEIDYLRVLVDNNRLFSHMKITSS